ncbi:MAG: sulfur carrier protein ThiS [Actinomycetota bacterium]|nr:sulfur carrier protein ThiS [Actinomycetota bacterium]
MSVLLNGQARALEDPATVADAVAAAEAPERGVAVAVDGEVVSRGAWGRTSLSDGQKVEVLQAVQGG